MRKLTVLSLVVVMILAMGSVVFAGGLNMSNDPLVPYDPNRLTGEINVSGNVGPYAAIFVTDGEVDLDWTGRELEASYGTAAFEIKSNTPIKFSAEMGPLSARINGSDYGIATSIDIERIGSLFGITTYIPVIARIMGANDGVKQFESLTLRGPVQRVEHRQYRVGIGGLLADIHDQAAGDYTTNVLLTVSAY